MSVINKIIQNRALLDLKTEVIKKLGGDCSLCTPPWREPLLEYTVKDQFGRLRMLEDTIQTEKGKIRVTSYYSRGGKEIAKFEDKIKDELY